MQSTLKYEYSTKNFHKFSAASGTPKEIYIPRAEMSHPVEEVTATVQISNHTLVAEKVRAK